MRRPKRCGAKNAHPSCPERLPASAPHWRRCKRSCSRPVSGPTPPGRRRPMPELHTLTATEMARLIAHRDVSPVEVVDALLARIAALEPSLEVWAALDADGARE